MADHADMAAFLVLLAREGIPPDVQERLISGGSLSRVLTAWNRRTPPSTAGWLPIASYDPKTSPDICLVAYECGHVTAAEYTEHLVGGPDDHQTWEAHIPPKDEKGEYRFFDAWPVAWMPYPLPPAQRDFTRRRGN